LDNAGANDNKQDMLRGALNMHAHFSCGDEFSHVRCGARALNLIIKEGEID